MVVDIVTLNQEVSHINLKNVKVSCHNLLREMETPETAFLSLPFPLPFPFPFPFPSQLV